MIPPETKVPCKYCGKPTIFAADKTCTNCWEVRVRLHEMPPEVIAKLVEGSKE